MSRRVPQGWRDEQMAAQKKLADKGRRALRAVREEQLRRLAAAQTVPAERPLVLTLSDYLPPALNGSSGLLRTHWSSRRRDGETATMRVRLALGPPPWGRFEGPVRAKFWRMRQAGGPMDRDNATSSWKLIGDALQSLGILADDSLIRELRVGQARQNVRRTIIYVGEPASTRCCSECWCTELDCRQCIARTGAPCVWVEPYLCSACAQP